MFGRVVVMMGEEEAKISKLLMLTSVQNTLIELLVKAFGGSRSYSMNSET